MNYLEALNQAQKNAVTTTDGPLLVLAGAGAGKTRVIVHRILHLILQGVSPHNILAVTFTNKAAKEMRERVEVFLNKSKGGSRAVLDSRPTVCTFHALGVRILRDHHALLSIKRQFTIYDRSDSVAAIKKALKKAGYDSKQFEPRKILSMISRAKGDALTRATYRENAKSYLEEVAASVWEHYDEILKETGALDFDDLLSKTLLLLKNHSDVLKTYRERYTYVHIDEYQDTNRVQFEIARLLVGERANLCVVGDVDQSIYSWRGADTKNILQFERYFPEAKVIMLEQNYRSTKTIIDAANDIIEKNINRPEKRAFTENHAGELLSLYTAAGEEDEAEYVALTSKALIESGASPSHIAVLFRTNFQSRALEEAFINFEVPYQVLGTRFFERKEVKDILSFLRFALNKDAVADLSRIINVPSRGIGKVTLLKLIEGKVNDLPKHMREKVDTFYALIGDIRAYALEHTVDKTLVYILKQTGMEKTYRKGGDEGLERLENIRELVSLGTKYREYEPTEAIEKLLEDAALASDQDEMKDKIDAVRLMTVHASKGLEFPYVFITGLEEGLFPHERLSNERIDEEEERRLFYVALTRAEKKLFLSFAHTRTIFGSQRVNVPSSFLNDIRGELIESVSLNAPKHGGIIHID